MRPWPDAPALRRAVSGMAIYTFYLCSLGGGSSSFESFEVGGDDDGRRGP